MLLFPLMPAFVLANRVYYLQQAYVVERELQTMEWGVAHTDSQGCKSCNSINILGMSPNLSHILFRSFETCLILYK